jgi:hypothetical protein
MIDSTLLKIKRFARANRPYRSHTAETQKTSRPKDGWFCKLCGNPLPLQHLSALRIIEVEHRKEH